MPVTPGIKKEKKKTCHGIYQLLVITTHWPVLTVLALTHLPYTSGGSIRKYRTITSSHGPQRVHLISSWSRDLTCHGIYQICVTVFWKTDRMVTNTEIHFLPVDECHTHALPRDTMHLRLDGQVCFYRRLFCHAV